MRINDLFESEESDRLDRMRAVVAHGQIKHWLEHAANMGVLERRLTRITEGIFEGSFVIRSDMFDMDADYPNLYIIFTPSKQIVHGQYVSDGAYFRKGLKSFIVSPVLIGPYDTKYLSTRFGAGGRIPFMHEFIHYLLHNRQREIKGSASHAEAGDMVSYFNDPQETNAHYQEGAQKAIEFIAAVARNAPQHAEEWLDWTTQQFVSYIKSTFMPRDFMDHATPQTIRALDKRLARFVETTIRPLVAKVKQGES